MIRRRIALMALLATPRLARSQGVAPEDAGLLRAAPAPEAHRSTPPARTDLSATVPLPRTQGPTASCVSWAATYGAASQALRRRGGAMAGIALSPAFTYALVAQDRRCLATTRISVTLDLLRDTGSLPIEDFAFDAGWCGRVPTADERARAARHRIGSWAVFEARDPAAVKAQLAEGRTVIFAISYAPSFQRHRGAATYDSLESGPGSFGHAMLVVGHDDAREAFRVQNSQGTGWGDGGYAWMGYAAWRRLATIGFVITG